MKLCHLCALIKSTHADCVLVGLEIYSQAGPAWRGVKLHFFGQCLFELQKTK